MTVAMKLITILLLLPSAALAQITSKPAPATVTAKSHATTKAAAGAGGCVTEPPLNPRVPALPAGTPCAKHLYTITTEPNIKLENISPMEGPGLADRLDVRSTSFSLDYIEVKTGTGELAAPHKYYTVAYTGYLPDGSVFDSSTIQGQPHTFLYGERQVILGWDTGLNGMRVGGKRRLFIPWQLGYGLNGRAPKIPPKTELIFDVELLSQSDKAPAPPPPPTPVAKPGAPPAASAPPAVPAVPVAPAPPTAPTAAPPPASAPPQAAPPPKPQ
jgi:peptidylprolyl isomerase